LRSFIKSAATKAEALRAQAILLSNERGRGSDIQTFTGYNRTYALDLKARYRKEGIGVLKDKRKGKPKELLTKKQREQVFKALKEKKPSDLGYAHEHWTTGILADWIGRKFKARYKSKTSLYLIFKKASFTYHRPGTVYRERDEKEVAQWRKTARRKLKALLREKHTIILAGDEMILTTHTTTQKVWLPAGEYPKIEVSTSGRKRRSVYGFLNLKSGQEHAYKTERQTMHVSADVLKKVRAEHPKRKIALFWDNAGWHKGSAVQEYIKEDKNIEIIHFPRYAPDENPQENVWKAGRSAVSHNRYIEDIDTATDELVHYFNTTKFPYSFLGECLVS
jgi:transposase